MAAIKLADFGLGIDTRRSASSSNPHSFRDIVNCHITTGHTLKRRGGFKHIAELPLNTAGLLPHNGALNIFKVTSLQSGLVAVPAVDNVVHINADTTPIVTNELELTTARTTVFQAFDQNAPFFHTLGLWDIRRIHFADVFHASPYIIAEHYDGSKSHHYLNGQPLVDRVKTWQETVGVDNNWLSPVNHPTVPFIFK
ncbi:MAG: hypothetical protein R8M45_05680, partial [Ghiorsea sp.]